MADGNSSRADRLSPHLFRCGTVLGVLFLLSGGTLARDYHAPDGLMTAHIERSDSSCEARIVWHGVDARLVFEKAYVSSDREHGYCIRMAGWTPDSQFFVYSLYSSGGHQPWRVPVMFFSRRDAKVASLDDFLPDPVTGEQFLLSAPDVVEVTTTHLPLDGQHSVQRRVSLGRISRGGALER